MLEKRLYNIILWFALGLSIISIITNIIGDFPWAINIKWVVLSLVTLVCFIFNRTKHNFEKTKLYFFLFLIVVFVPFSFFDSGGSVNNILGYSYILLICIVFLFDEKKRIALVITHILIITFLHVVEHEFPQLVKVYSDESNFIEKLTQIPIIMFAIYMITSQFANAYLLQREKQEKDNERLERIANYDSLTQLYNRRAFNQVLNNHYYTSSQLIDTYIVIIDLDYFKHINDQLGHFTGDEVLKKFAQELKMLISDPSIICRWGGDEFALLFHGDSHSLETTLKKMQESYKKITSELEIDTGISIGAALWEDDVSIEEIMIKADKRLYEVKSKDRGQYSL